MNEEITIKNGELDLLASGTIIVDQNLPTKLTLKGENETPIELIIVFSKDDSNPKKQETKNRFFGEHTMEVNFVNFDSPLGTYGTKIWELGNLKRRKLFFYYIVRELANTDMKQIGYTFYLGEEVHNG